MPKESFLQLDIRSNAQFEAHLTPDGILLIAAMREELQGLFEKAGLPVIYTGLGKINATYRLTRALMQVQADGGHVRAVVNFGTAGSARFKTHELVELTQFVQRDMDVTPLGFQKGTTPFDKMTSVIEVEKRFSSLPSGACGTGDSFEVAHPQTHFAARDEHQQSSFFAEESKIQLAPYYDVVDMEAYALAKICALESLKFISIKYISDGADAVADQDWLANLPGAAQRFFDLYPAITHQLAGADGDGAKS